MINLCYEHGYYPTQIKIGYVTPIFKTGDRKLCSNYRRTAITSSLNKIFEKFNKLNGRFHKDKLNSVR